MSSEKLIELEGISLTRQGRRVLENLSWTVSSGEHWFILGQNGSGKTSLLEVILGYLWASSGTVRILGETYGKTYLPGIRREIGYVAPWVLKRIPSGETVWEVVASGTEGSIRYFGEVSDELLARIEQWLERFGCLGYLETPFDQLSTGEQLKVLIARSFVRGHRLLILDEAFAALDLGARVLIHRLLDDVARGEAAPSILLVTHQLEEILPFYTHGLLLKKGKIHAAGPKEAILKSDLLAGAFDAPLRIASQGGSYFLCV